MSFTKPNDPAAGVNPASYAAQAQPDKVDWDIIAAGAAGTGLVSGCAVTAQATPNMTVAVAAGTIAVLSAQHAVTGANVTVGTADATNPRIDLIVSSSSGVLSCQAGTASSVPCMPNVPASSVALAEVYVPAGATSITSAQIRDLRVQIATTVHHKHFTRTAGDYSLTSSTWANLDTGSDLTVTAAVGDVLKAALNAASIGNNAVTALNVCTVVSGSPVNFFGSGEPTTTTGDGISGWYYNNTGLYVLYGIPKLYTVQAGDIVAGQVTVRLRYRSSATNGISANTTRPFEFSVENIGPQG